MLAAKEINLQPINTAQEVDMDIRREYTEKLILNDYVIPDAVHLGNWCSEQDAICLWPNILYPDYKLAKCGSCLHDEFPFLGSSPDHIVVRKLASN